MNIRIALIALSLLLFAGCESYTPCVEPADAPKEGSAYIYGRFRQDVNAPSHERAIVHSTGILIDSVDSEEYYILKFMTDNEVYAIEVKPGKYFISQWMWTDPFGYVVMDLLLKKYIENNNFQIESGHLYYLGDFLSYGYFGEGYLTRYYVFEVPENCFDETTNEFIEKYPLFRELPQSPVFDNRFFKEEFNSKHVVRQGTTFVPVIVPGG